MAAGVARRFVTLQPHAIGHAAGGLAGAQPGRSPAGFALVLQPGVGAGVSERPATSAPVVARPHGPWQAAASVVYGRDQLQARNDPWLQMLALQASGYGARRKRLTSAAVRAAIVTRPAAPTRAVRPVSNPLPGNHARVVPVQAVPRWAGCDTDLPSTVSRRWFALPCYSTVCGFPPSDSAESKTVTIHLGAPMPWT